MTGNATEEYLLTKLDYPGHIDAGRMGGLAGSITGIVSGLVAKAYLGAAFWVVIGFVLGLGVGAWTYRRINRRQQERDVAQRTETRARQEKETQRQIAAMNAGKSRRAGPRDMNNAPVRPVPTE